MQTCEPDPSVRFSEPSQRPVLAHNDIQHSNPECAPGFRIWKEYSVKQPHQGVERALGHRARELWLAPRRYLHFGNYLPHGVGVQGP